MLETSGLSDWKKVTLKKAEMNVAGRKTRVTRAIVRMEMASLCVSSAMFEVALLSSSDMRLKYYHNVIRELTLSRF